MPQAPLFEFGGCGCVEDNEVVVGKTPSWAPLEGTPDLASYDIILLNSSAGKDSQAMLDYVVSLADAAGVRDRLVVLHCDLGRMEHAGTVQLARTQAVEHYGLPFFVRKNVAHEDLLARVRHRRQSLDAKGHFDAPAWPSPAARYCTAEFKTGVAKTLVTELVARAGIKGRQVRVLNCLGLRAEESPARRKKVPYKHHVEGKGWSNGKRSIDEWLPIHTWTVGDVWARIAQSGVPHHPAYDASYPRLSCKFCILGSRSMLVRSAQEDPELAGEYAAVEVAVRSRFRLDVSIAEIIEEARAVEAVVEIGDWAL